MAGIQIASPSTTLKSFKGISSPMMGAPAGFGVPAGLPGYGQPKPAPNPPQLPNSSTAHVGTAGTEYTDGSGKVHSYANTGSGPAFDQFGQPTGYMPSETIDDPDATRRRRDLNDYGERREIDARYAPKEAGPAPGIDVNELPGLLDKFKPDQVPREGPMATPAREVGKGPEDRTAAESAAFSRAAERIANVGRGNLAGLRNQMTRRGISGSDIEAKGISDVQNNTAGQLGEVIRDQAIEGLRREQAIDDRDLASNVQQRQQDIGVGTTNYSGGVQQRGQDLQGADWKLNALPSLLALMRMKSGAQ